MNFSGATFRYFTLNIAISSSSYLRVSVGTFSRVKTMKWRMLTIVETLHDTKTDVCSNKGQFSFHTKPNIIIPTMIHSFLLFRLNGLCIQFLIVFQFHLYRDEIKTPFVSSAVMDWFNFHFLALEFYVNHTLVCKIVS